MNNLRNISEENLYFLEFVGKLATAEMKKSNILASVITAQAIIESGWGKSPLAVYGKALFGIKATGINLNYLWRGKVINKNTLVCFDLINFEDPDLLYRSYDSWEESITDHTKYLTDHTRYAGVVGEKDFEKVCEELKRAGYAADPDYDIKLKGIIVRYDLTRYDKE